MIEGPSRRPGADAFVDRDIYVIKTGSPYSYRYWDFNSTTNVLYPCGLAFSSTGAYLFAVSGDVSATTWLSSTA